MFDHPKPTASGWAHSAQAGHVVLFHFPTPVEPGPVLARPCLVLAAKVIGGEVRLTLASGTEDLNAVDPGPHVLVRTANEFAAAGLANPMWFDCYRALTVSTRNASFAIDPVTQSPIVGWLTGGSHAQMQRVMAALNEQTAHVENRLRSRQSGRADEIAPRPTVVPFPRTA